MDDIFQFSGLPLHPLLVHAVVILLPLTVIAVLLSQFWPAARRRIGVVSPLAALLVLVLVPITVAAGQALSHAVGPAAGVKTHEGYAEMLLPWAIGLFVVAVGQWIWYRWGAPRLRESRRGTARAMGWVLGVLSVAIGVGSVTLLVLIGESGSRAVWAGILE
jgi:hypothetical protein